MSKAKAEKKLRVAFIHPDLGIGGAERLVVDAAVSLQKLGHNVTMFTSRHDPKRCFEETRDGTLTVHVLGSSLPMTLHPKIPLTIVFSILRSILLSFLLIFSLFLPGPPSAFNPLSPLEKFDVFIVDQQSVCVPLLRFVTGTRVVFYCHFPDKLLSAGWKVAQNGEVTRTSGGLLRAVYRWPIDKLEEWTTGQSDVVLANSKFTSKVYAHAFPSLAKRAHPPKVVYPCIDLDQYATPKSGKGKSREDPTVTAISSSRPTVISLNRFEAKKNVDLAIKAFAEYIHSEEPTQPTLRLVVAGGYDSALDDNVLTLNRLKSLCSTYNLSYHVLESKDSPAAPPDTQVLFVLNFSNAQRSYLLSSPNTLALLYTPTNEHFGIVPIEAGACGLPVLATNTGGPLETVLEGQTGYLRSPQVGEWLEALTKLVDMSDKDRKAMSKTAKERVKDNFSLSSLGREMDQACREALSMGDLHTHLGDSLIWGGLSLMGGSALVLGATVWLS